LHLPAFKEYGNENADKYIEWFLPFAYEFKRVLADKNSLRVLIQLGLLQRFCNVDGFVLKLMRITLSAVVTDLVNS
jgi:hypothetical protein